MSIGAIKREVRERDGHRCAECGMTSTGHFMTFGRELHVHRITPGSRYSAAPGVCVTLCRPCHKRKHPPRPKGSRVHLVLVVAAEIRDVLRAEHGLSKQPIAEIVSQLVRARFPETLREVRARRAVKEDRQVRG